MVNADLFAKEKKYRVYHTVEYDPSAIVNLPHAINFGPVCAANLVT